MADTMHESDYSSRKSVGGSGPRRGAAPGVAALPCHNSNISIETDSKPSSKLAKLSTQHRKSAFILKESVHALSDRFGVERLGFLTLTFADYVICPKEAQRRYNSLVSNVIKKRYEEHLGVFERQKSGRIHYHLLIVLGSDIRTGFDFGQVSNGNYSSAGPSLRKEWAFWRSTAKKYRFGRTELMPVRKDTDAMAKYVGKYIAKHTECRKHEDKGVRLVRYSKGARVGTTRFMFNSHGASEWRRKVAIFAEMMATRYERETMTMSDLSRILGPRWAYENREFILSLP